MRCLLVEFRQVNVPLGAEFEGEIYQRRGSDEQERQSPPLAVAESVDQWHYQTRHTADHDCKPRYVLCNTFEQAIHGVMVSRGGDGHGKKVQEWTLPRHPAGMWVQGIALASLARRTRGPS